MNVFWQSEPLTQEQFELMTALIAAHHQASFRENISSNTIINAMIGSGDYCKAVAAAILTMGNLHAPLAQSMRLLAAKEPAVEAKIKLAAGKLVPGWGSSFPAEFEMWEPVATRLKPAMLEKINAVTAVLHEAGKQIDPNPSTWTAATALQLHIPVPVAPYLFIMGRLGAWSAIAMKANEKRV